MCTRALLLSALLVTPALHAQGVSFDGNTQAQADIGQQLTFTIDTTDLPAGVHCALTMEIASSGQVPLAAEQVPAAAMPMTRTLTAKAAGMLVAQLDCRDAGGAHHVATLQIASDQPPSPDPTDGACGVAHGDTTDNIPTGTAACAAGDQQITDDGTDSGLFEWSCQGSEGGSDAYCMAVQEVAPPPHPSEGASFHGARSGFLAQTDTVSWDFPHAENCLAAGDWSGSQPASGTFSRDYFLGGQRSYQITCTNAAGAVTRTVALP